MKFCKKCGNQIADGQICACVGGSASPAPARTIPPAPTRTSMPTNTTARTTSPVPPHTVAQAAPSTHGSHLQGASASASQLASTMKNRFTGAGDLDVGGDPFERGLQIVPDCIAPNEGEIPVKQYSIATLSKSIFTKFEGKLQVTNQRVIFRASGRTILGRFYNHSEFAIDEIAGFDAMRDKTLNWLNLMVGGAITLFLGFGGVGMDGGLGALLVILALVSLVVTIYKSIRSCLSINIKNKGAQEVICIPLKPTEKIVLMPMPMTVEAEPAVDTEMAIRELGAIVNDIQKLGDHGVNKWL